MECLPRKASAFGSGSPSLSKIHDELPASVKDKWTSWVFRIAYRLLHYQPMAHLSVYWKHSTPLVLGLAEIEPDLIAIEVHLIPSQMAEFTKAISEMIRNNKYRLEILRQFITKFDVLLVIDEPSTNVVFGEELDIRCPNDFRWIALPSERQGTLYDLKLTINSGVRRMLLLANADVASDVFRAEVGGPDAAKFLKVLET